MDTIYQQLVSVLSELSFLSGFSIFVTLLLALCFDRIFKEATHFHYLVGFGYLANKLEKCINKPDFPPRYKRVIGAIAWCLLVLPLPILYFYFCSDLLWYAQILVDSVVLYLAIGLASLHQHAMQIYKPLSRGDLITARYFTGYIVSRETNNLSEQEISRATVESMLENGHDSVIASLFYYIIGGAPLVIIHRLANTLDAMWGYKNTRFNEFGYASARLDDLLGFASGKCCTLLYAIQGITKQRVFKSLSNAYSQGSHYKSHNGGWVMAAGATVMGITLGGKAVYHGNPVSSLILGSGTQVTLQDIPKSLTLVTRASLLLLIAVFVVSVVKLIWI